MSQKLLRRLAFAAPFAIIGLFIGIAALRLNFPAVHYDEALYVNAALGGVDNTTFMTKTVGPFPVLLMPYIGALKSYLYMPIFYVFGVHPVSMRLPSLIFMGVGLYVLYALLQKRLGRMLALGTLLATATSASFIIFSRLDFGPVVLDFVLKVIGLLLLLRFVEKRRLSLLIPFWGVMFLGVFNKLNFLWYVNAYVFGFLVVWGRDFWCKTPLRDIKRLVALSAMGFAACAGYVLLINKTYSIGGAFGFVGWHYAYGTLQELVSGSWFYGYAFSPQPLGSPLFFWFMAAVIVAGGLYTLYARHTKQAVAASITRLYGFSAAVLLAILAQAAITKQATAGWHYFAVYPFFTLLFVLGLYVLLGATFRHRQQWVRLGFAATLAATSIYQLGLYRAYFEALSKPTSNISWSPALYKLLNFTRAHPHSQFMSLDWGLQSELLALDPVPNKYFEVLGPLRLTDPTENNHLFQTYLASKTQAYYIGHAVGQEITPTTRADILKLAAQHGYTLDSVEKIGDGHQTIFVLYHFTPASN